MMSDDQRAWSDPAVAGMLAETEPVPLDVSVQELRRSRQMLARLVRLLRQNENDAADSVTALVEWIARQEAAPARPLYDPGLVVARRERDRAAARADAALSDAAALRARKAEAEAWARSAAAAVEGESRQAARNFTLARKAKQRAAELEAALLAELLR